MPTHAPAAVPAPVVGAPACSPSHASKLVHAPAAAPASVASARTALQLHRSTVGKQPAAAVSSGRRSALCPTAIGHRRATTQLQHWLRLETSASGTVSCAQQT